LAINWAATARRSEFPSKTMPSGPVGTMSETASDSPKVRKPRTPMKAVACRTSVTLRLKPKAALFTIEMMRSAKPGSLSASLARSVGETSGFSASRTICSATTDIGDLPGAWARGTTAVVMRL
jgi:hypothetical protein